MCTIEGCIIHWDLWVDLVGILVWPIVTLIILATFQNPLRELLTRADSFEVGGVKVSRQIKALTAEVTEELKEAERTLKQSPEDMAAVMAEEPVADEGAAENQPLIEAGWSQVSSAIGAIFQEIGNYKGEESVPKLAKTYFSQRRYLLCSNQLVVEGWISFGLRDAIKALLDVRSSLIVQNAKVSAKDAEIFSRNCKKIAQSISNAVKYRLRREAPPPTPADTE